MSNSSPAGAKPPKIMSSRLMTMKFMQRAAASSPSGSNRSSPGTQSPGSESQAQDDGSTGRSPKRSKLSHRPSLAADTESATPSRSDDARSALLSAEETRQAALARSWRGAETKWSFAVSEDAGKKAESGLRVEMLRGRGVGDDDEESQVTPIWRSEEGSGRMTFGSKRKHVSKEETTGDEGSDKNSGSEDSEDSLDIEDQEMLAKVHRKTSDRPNGIDRRSGRISGGIQDLDRIQCHSCQEFGHISRDCPKKWNRRQRQPMGSRSTG